MNHLMKFEELYCINESYLDNISIDDIEIFDKYLNLMDFKHISFYDGDDDGEIETEFYLKGKCIDKYCDHQDRPMYI